MNLEGDWFKVEAKVQYRLSESDNDLYDLWCSLKKQEQLTKRRGLASRRFRDMAKAYLLISEHFGESDPYKLMIKIASQQGATQAPQKEEEEIEDYEDVRIDADVYLKQFENIG